MKTSDTPLFWDKKAMQARIADSKTRIRHEGGSPNPEEIDQYNKYLMEGISSTKETNAAKVLVMGMTPELRTMVLNNGYNLTSVDISSDAIHIYKDWVPSDPKGTETIVQGSWWDIGNLTSSNFDAVLGDGIFGNVLSLDKHIELLQIIKKSLKNTGRMILRKALFVDGINPADYTAEVLIGKYRSGKISGSEFGFSMRLWGNWNQSYDPDTYILDNAITFKLYKEWFDEGKLTEQEYACIYRYYFKGLNMILSQKKWEELLAMAGCAFTCHPLKGKDWYAYYPVYSCRFT